MKLLFSVLFLALTLSLPAAANTAWSNSERSHVNTWAFLRVLKQYNNVFSTAGTILLSDLPGTSSEVEARLLADQLHKLFTAGLGAEATPQARKKLFEAFSEGSSMSLEDFANYVVNPNYRFNI